MLCRENELPSGLENGLGDSASLQKGISCSCLIAGIGMLREWAKSCCLKWEEKANFVGRKQQFHPLLINFYLNKWNLSRGLWKLHCGYVKLWKEEGGKEPYQVLCYTFMAGDFCYFLLRLRAPTKAIIVNSVFTHPIGLFASICSSTSKKFADIKLSKN